MGKQYRRMERPADAQKTPDTIAFLTGRVGQDERR